MLGVVLVCLTPAVGGAATLLMDLQPFLAPLPNYLGYAAGVFAAFCLAAALCNFWRVLRGPRRPTHLSRGAAAWRLAGFLAWGALPFAVLWLIADRERLLLRLPSLGIGALWTLSLLPALTFGADGRLARWLRLGNLLLTDAAAGVFFAHFIRQMTHEIFFLPLIFFTLVLHVAVLTGWTVRGARRRHLRWLIFLLLLLFSADFFRPAGTMFHQRDLLIGPVRQIKGIVGPLHQALLDRQGESAFVLLHRGATEFYQVQLSDGAASRIATAAPIAALALDPSRRTLAVAYEKESARIVELFDAVSLTSQGYFQGGGEFTPQALSISDRYVAVGGEGKTSNLLICPTATPEPGYLDECKKFKLPLSRIGQLAIAPGRYVFAAEGERWLADGWSIQVVSLAKGELLHRMALGQTLGEMIYDPLAYHLYVARPALGQVEICAVDRKLIPRGLAPTENEQELGWRYLRLDDKRNLLIGASRQTGYVVVYNLKTKQVTARLAIGSGISSLDYHPTQSMLLVAADRGLVRINLSELPGMNSR